MADFYTLLTNAGIAYETACKAAGTPIKLAKMSVGDGNGSVYNPDATATALKREVWRGDLNALFQDQANPSWLLAEVTIPAEVGGWYVREAGLWTDTGILYAIVKYPESFKPVLASSGSGKEFYIRSIFETSNAALVTLLIDDTVVKATRAWVASYVADELAKLDQKQSVRAATTANIVLVGAQVIDGRALVAGDRCLVKNQTLAKENGPYVVANGAWTRAKDADNSAKVTPNMMVAVEEGATQADTVWQLVTDGPIVLGTTALTFQDVTAGFARLLSPGFGGNPTAPTPVQFDSSGSLATTAFVKRAGVEYSNLGVVGVSTVLTSSSIGGVVSAASSTPISVTLPPTAGVPHGATLEVVNAGSGLVTVLPSGSDVLTTQAGLAVPVVMALGDNAYFIKVTGEWRLRGGSISLKYSSVFSGANWVTQPQFDSTKALATTEFVQRAMGSLVGYVSIAASRALTVADIGKILWLSSSGVYTLTLPSPTSMGVPVGSSFNVFSTSGSGVVAIGGSATLQDQKGLLTSSVPFKIGQSARFVAIGVNQWLITDSTAAMGNNSDFASVLSLAASSQELPGLSMKTGTVSNTSTAAFLQITFPVSFPSTCVALVITGWSNCPNAFTHTGRDRSGAMVSRGANQNYQFDYIAFGF
ncbi:phage tail protein [Pseudomonas frederiksbergensis]|uniref:phage tail protein n=1 Tax=Pseudomonas frederiksbergensis TaxID=104087 RepID=UPI000F4A463A|nr:phage tail protein [Pseudomonas frederiksbergensis]